MKLNLNTQLDLRREIIKTGRRSYRYRSFLMFLFNGQQKLNFSFSDIRF